MNAAVRLVDVSIRPSIRPSLRPTFAPSSRATVIPNLTGSFATEPPSTQRSATVHPRFETASRQEATNLLCVMRLNVDFLQSLLHGQAAMLATTALADLNETIDRLEHRLGASARRR
ncbi:MAG: hypothetical protein JWO86_7446 [Myxococcaceae bacterium]|jgi:hypothetical protein|nr:hypothetical protein [Myxococcaceae bacterium]MEA2752649.1 hypothetical protein [Myxococcales bacterium]